MNRSRTAPAALDVLHAPDSPQAVVLLLHGGRADSLAPPTLLNLPARRMHLLARALRRQLPGDAVLIARVRYRYRGWNGHAAHPVQDAHRALGELARLVPGLPVALVGHSMGGRAAIAAAGRPGVRGVVALAPWCPPGEPVAHLAGRSLVILHDERDPVTSAAQSWDLARRAAAAGARVGTIVMPRGRHTMLLDACGWHRLTVDAVAAVLTGAPLVLASATPVGPHPRAPYPENRHGTAARHRTTDDGGFGPTMPGTLPR
ncbi:lysophospholipase [Kitasatospora sp. DSM 101779]|uniref:lysophospholipase n=1 Tax=Kitasatospora sp. DSM 101779 TaxID=2853165 RepID=UPI0021D82BB9|nr:lysophospholipase [Kitasatospora sp. DSM 101779]MCU7820207.1 lysophospholipase [Kitasatospora sp. DSM 101779]